MRGFMLRRSTPPPVASEATLLVDGREVGVELRPNPRARRIILRMNKAGTGVRLTVPAKTDAEDALRFAQRHVDWIRTRLASVPDTGRVRRGVHASPSRANRMTSCMLDGCAARCALTAPAMVLPRSWWPAIRRIFHAGSPTG